MKIVPAFQIDALTRPNFRESPAGGVLNGRVRTAVGDYKVSTEPGAIVFREPLPQPSSEGLSLFSPPITL